MNFLTFNFKTRFTFDPMNRLIRLFYSLTLIAFTSNVSLGMYWTPNNYKTFNSKVKNNCSFIDEQKTDKTQYISSEILEEIESAEQESESDIFDAFFNCSHAHFNSIIKAHFKAQTFEENFKFSIGQFNDWLWLNKVQIIYFQVFRI